MPQNLAAWQQKKILRAEIKKLREILPQQEVKDRSNKILSNLWQISTFNQTKSVFCYISFRNEVDTFPVIKQLLAKQITVAVPKMVDKMMIPVEIKSVDNLIKSKFSTLEPVSSVVLKQPLSLCLTPGIAFSKDGGRLGWGGGYYDAYFEQNPDIIKIGLAYNFQVVDYVPVDEKDQKIDIIVTEDEVIRCP